MYFWFLRKVGGQEAIDRKQNLPEIAGSFFFFAGSWRRSCTIRLVANAATIMSGPDGKKCLVKQAKCDRLRAKGRA